MTDPAMADTLANKLAGWRGRLRARIAASAPGATDDEVERRFQAVLDYPVPSDEDLVAMQARGGFPSDDELAAGEGCR